MKLLHDLSQIVEQQRALEDVRRELIAECRKHNVPWRAIGAALGVTAQSAQERYGRRAAEGS